MRIGSPEAPTAEVRNRALEDNDTQILAGVHPNKQILEGLEDVRVDDVERRIVEYDSPVRRRFLDNPHGRRLSRFGHGSSSLDFNRAGRCADLLLLVGTHAGQPLIGDAQFQKEISLKSKSLCERGIGSITDETLDVAE